MKALQSTVTSGVELGDEEGGMRSMAVRSPVSDAQELNLSPHSIQAEQAVVGGLLINNGVWDAVSGLVSEADFYLPEHQHVFRIIASLFAKSVPADVITVTEEARSAGIKISSSYVRRLCAETPSAVTAEHYAKLVRQKAIERRMIVACQKAIQSVVDPAGETAAQVLDGLQSELFAIGESGSAKNQGFQPIGTILHGVIESIQAAQEKDDKLLGVSTGLNDFDEMTSGLRPTDLIIVAGRPSMGKTAFAMNIAENVAVEEGMAVAVFSMEMGASQLAMRLLSQIARIEQSALAKGVLNDDEWSRMSFAIGKLHDAPIYIDEGAALTTTEVRSRARKLKRQVGHLGLVVVDYLQLMSGSKRTDNRVQEISEISGSLKAMAKELGCPVIALSQLSRKVEERAEKRPLMSDLRESGSIEQDADVIVFLYRDDYYNPDSQDKGVAEAIIAKHRNGGTGAVKLAFNGKYTRFSNLFRGDY